MHILIALILLCALPLGSGCEDEGEIIVVPNGYADSLDDAVLRWRNAYTQMSPADLELIMAEDFEFQLDSIDADSLGILTTWDRDEELLSAARMLSGQPGIRIDGTEQPPIDDFIVSFDSSPGGIPSTWELVESGPLRGSYRREYAAVGQLLDANRLLDFIIGKQVVHVRETSISVNGACCADVFQIVHWSDVGLYSQQKHGSYSWGRVRARWRTLPANR